jgi:hypothetical protein
VRASRARAPATAATTAATASATAAAPAAARAPRQQQPERKGPSKSDRLAALMRK